MNLTTELDKSNASLKEDSKILTSADPIAKCASTYINNYETEDENSEKQQLAARLEQNRRYVKERVTVNEDRPQCTGTTESKKEYDETASCILQQLHQTTVSILMDESENVDIQDGRFIEGATSKSLPPNNETHYVPARNPNTDRYTHDPDTYDFSHQKRGYALIIVNDDFNEKGKRPGAMDDLLKMKIIVRKLGFEILNLNNECNLNKPDTLRLLNSARQLNHAVCDSFVLMISSHGFETQNTRANGRLDQALVCADNDYIFTRDILEMFNDKMCPGLRDKPKLFFIQACRGKGCDHGCNINVFPTPKRPVVTLMKPTATDLHHVEEQTTAEDNDGKSVPQNSKHASTMSDEQAHEESAVRDSDVGNTQAQTDAIQYAPSRVIADLFSTKTPVLQCYTDMLVMYAIPDGTAAWRSPAGGSWMIDDLYRVISSYDLMNPQSFLRLLTKVSFKMSLRETHIPNNAETHMSKAVPVIVYKLLKDVVFGQKE